PQALLIEQTPCSADSTGTLYPGANFTFVFDGECTVAQFVVDVEGTLVPFDVVAPDNVNGSQFGLIGFTANVTYGIFYVMSDGTSSDVFSFTPTDCSFDEHICDCDGNQHTIGVLGWLGDTYADDGTYTWEGQTVNFNCATWGYDCGDVIGAPADDPFAVCSGNLPPNNGCDASVVLGCTDMSAINYNPAANLNDGSCEYLISGCTNYYAINYDNTATEDDGSCFYDDFICDCAGNQHTIGVLIWQGDNFADDGSYLWDNVPVDFNCATWGYDCGDIAGSPVDDPYGTCIGILPPSNGCGPLFSGCTDLLACNYNNDAVQDDGSCAYPGCNIVSAVNYNPLAGCNDGSCIFTVPGCTIANACNYNPSATTNNGSCLFIGAICNDNISTT
ncbi:MAG: hypothetical protein ACKOSR_06910, partial [Flavobacteriales bacterium]